MSNPFKGEEYIGISGALEHLKTGDEFNIQSGQNVCQSFTVLGANIVHRDHPPMMRADNKTATSTTITLTITYPFGRRGGDTPLRYVVYAELSH